MSLPHPNPKSSSPRRTHRKRVSALRLSSDTTSTLPEYLPIGWHPQPSLGEEIATEEDRPPDYPDSAEEADEDTDTDSNVVYVPHLPPSALPSPRVHASSPRRSKRFLPTHKRRQSSQNHFLPQKEPNDPYLDSLLERSVHALEMSNTLLQSSISTQTSLSTILAPDAPGDSSLEARAIGLSSRIRDTWDARETWADDLEEITRNVEGLFGNDPDPDLRRHSLRSSEGSVSSSLPSSNSFSIRRNRRTPSLDLRHASDSATSGLHYSQQSRANLISPPPRALTQFVASTQDAESILLPSTIGLRSPPSLHHSSDWRPLNNLASSSTTSLLSTPSFSTSLLPPKLTDKPLEPSTPAYNMLSSFVYRASSSETSTPSTSFTSSFMTRRRDSSHGSANAEQSNGHGNRRRSTSPASHRKSADRIHRQDRYTVVGSGSSQTPKRGVSPLGIRPMTPPAEESSSSSDGCLAKRTVQSLRKIMDEQPLPPATLGSMSRTKITHGQHLRPPVFLPRTPVPVADAGTSTATASISRLYTKGTHSSSTRAPSPPRQSALKRSSPSISRTASDLETTPAPTPTALSLPDLMSKVLLGGSSAPSSGQSTPNSKRISFAELPESYASTRPPSQRFKDKQARKRNRSRKTTGADGAGSSSADAKGKGKGDEGQLSGWWAGWLTGGAAEMNMFGTNLARHEERLEDRMTRSWGGRMNSGFGGGLDEWAV
ncbi:hypothetical protein M413DRAFT_441603 [Hebeloma cylindrosporum]|uniref:Uncharacterized protein n=1 Tax=Hebeloma cylindrosporum TaxID=76867 RepID=A0A0C3CCK3_HEBCY|nr:hypothetical protein M413DRAFT_441603 [Hebeloma cylindrosporum h7]